MKATLPATLAVLSTLLLAQAPAHAGNPAKGKQAYDMYCVACHGANGTSPTAPDLSSNEFLSLVSHATLKTMIGEGRPGRPMPAWKDMLSPEQLDDVAAYLKSWQKSPDLKLSKASIKGDVKGGKKTFDTTCASCHGVNGAGDSAPALNNAAFLKAVSDDYIRQTLVHGRPGTPMRSFAGPLGLAALDDQELNDVVAYIRSWQKKK